MMRLRPRRTVFVAALVGIASSLTATNPASVASATSTARASSTTASCTSAPVSMVVNAAGTGQTISPLIYGFNTPSTTDTSVVASMLASSKLTMIRLGGNRWTAYNWVNNASNAGSDYQFENDDYLSSSTTPGAAVEATVQADQQGGATTMVSVPIGDYVAADTGPGGDVRDSGSNYLATRFRRNLVTSPTPPTSTVPNPSSANVYQDQFAKWLTTTNPTANFMFSLDNEVNDWSSTHAELYAKNLGYTELVQRDLAYAAMLKTYAPTSLVTGPVLDGFQGQQDPVANNGSSADYQHFGPFLPYYLTQVAAAEKVAKKRLIDVLDLHWYPQVTPEVFNTSTTPDVTAAREQAPRSLWDPSYVESSWISQYVGGPIDLIPKLRQQIATYDPGIGLGFTEWNYGGGGDISGAIATADTLGIMGRYGVKAASYWPQFYPNEAFALGAFSAFRNYDGHGAHFGDMEVPTSNSSTATTSIYASTTSSDPHHVVIIAINKATVATPTKLVVQGITTAKAAVFTLTSANATPVAAPALSATSPSTFNYTMPAQSISIIVPAQAGSAPAFFAKTPSTPARGVSYSYGFGATGSPSPTYSVKGTLPPGLSLNATTGRLSGVPTKTGVALFSVTATNVHGTASSGPLSLRTVASARAVFVASNPPPASWDQPYSYTFGASGTPRPVYAVTKGNLPEGLCLDGASGQLRGVATKVETASFVVTASNGVVPSATTATRTITVARPTAGSVLGWGRNDSSQLGTGFRLSTSAPAPVPMPRGVVVAHVAAGLDHSLALSTTGEVYAWGNDNCGQLGDGRDTGCNGPLLQSTPTKVNFPPGTPKVTSIVAGWEDSFAVTADGQAWAWGDNGVGELGIGGAGWQPRPVLVHLGSSSGHVTAIAAAAFTTYALTDQHQVLAWGYGGNGALGNGTSADGLVASLPVEVSLGANSAKIVQIAAGGSQEAHVVALTASGHVVTWGGNNSGQLGNATSGSPSADSALPVDLSLPVGESTMPTFVSVGAASYASYATTATGVLYAWGNNVFGQLGDGTNSHFATSPIHVGSPIGLTSAPAATTGGGGDYFGLELTRAGKIYASGANDEGELGTGSTAWVQGRPAAALLPASTAISSVSAGPSFVLAVVR